MTTANERAIALNPIAVEKAKRYAVDTAEEAMFLDMIGLVGPDGEILPDDTRRYDLHESDPVRAVTPTALRVVQG